MERRSIGVIGAVVAIVLFFAVNVLANAALRSVRVDLTEENLFTLSDGSKNIARKVDEPIRLYLYYAEEQGRQYPQIKDYANHVRDVLDEYVLHSDGKLILEVVNPEPYSEEEERAVREGIFALPLPNGDPLYFGLVGTNATGDRQVIPYFDAFDPTEERFLEYKLSRLIYTLAHPEKKTVGILSSLPIQGGGGNPMMPQSGSPRWKILDQLDSFFDTRMLDPGAAEIPDDVDVLLVIHPRNFSDATLYAIDQYVLGGGKLVAFVDPHCEEDQSGADPSNPYSQIGASRASDLNKLFQAWGFEMVPNKVVGDRLNALRVSYRDGQRMREGPFVVWLGLDQKALDQQDPVTSLLKNLQLRTAGILRSTADSKTTLTPLVQSSEESMEYDVGAVQSIPNPDQLMRSFVPGFQRLTLAARVSGQVSSAFPDGDPSGDADKPVTVNDDGNVEGGPLEHLSESNGPVNMIVAADCDMLWDDTWVSEQRLMNISLGLKKTSDNGDFLINAIENLLGGEDLISIQARGNYSRPFARVDRIRLDAEQRYQSEEEELERRVQEAERRINQLQSEKTPGTSMILSPEQEAELEQAQKDMVETKKKLRDVQHEMRKDIERLGTKLKLVNIGLIPALVSIAAIALGAWRIQRRNR